VTTIACLAGLAVSILWTGGVWLGWPWVTKHLFDGKYTQDGWMVLLWGVASSISFAQTVVSASLQSLRAFKSLALANLAASLVAAVAILVIMQMMGYTGAILGTAVGQLIELVAMAVLLRLLIARQSMPSPTSRITKP
jgi:O-antigen/teichoic acid export membrane protein